VAALREEALARWPVAELDRRVRLSQRQRRLVFDAERQGHTTPWDFQPAHDASRQYVRSHMALDDIDAMARWPAFR